MEYDDKTILQVWLSNSWKRNNDKEALITCQNV